VRRPRDASPRLAVRLTTGGGSCMFYIIVFAGLAVLLVVAVIVQYSRKK
jgi:hypothetical protein